jgi:hypothetical protein
VFALSRQCSFFSPESPEELLSVHPLAVLERSPALVDLLPKLLIKDLLLFAQRRISCPLITERWE